MSDEGSRSGSTPASSSQSAPDAAPGPVPSPSSASSSIPLHAQAVRFLTSLRHHSPTASIEAQRDFLKGKGLDDTAIAAAFRAAERPPSLDVSENISPSASSAATGETLSEEAAFDQAARAFDDPIHIPAPVLPAKNYPRSPLALYYEEAEGRVIEASRRDEITRRYQVLLGFFKSMTWFLTFGGGVGALVVLMYRLFVMPKLVTTLDARSFLLKHHHSLWNNIVRSVQNLSQASLAPARPEAQTAKANMEPAEGKGQGRRSSLKKVQFADEVKGGGSLEEREGEKREKANIVLPGTDVVVPAETKDLSNSEKARALQGGEGAQEEEVVAGEEAGIEPIDVSQPLRASLAALSDRLRGGQAEASAATSSFPPASAQPSVSEVPTAADEEEGFSSDGSWQDDLDSDEEELELDPFAAPARKGRKRRGSHKKRKTSETSAPTAAAATTSTAVEGSSASLYDALLDLNSSVNARILHSQTRSFRASSTGGPYGTFNFAQTLAPSSSTGSGEAAKAGEADTVMETSAQIRAEIRSLKGLLLSRRNFPRPNGSAPRPPAPPSFSTST